MIFKKFPLLAMPIAIIIFAIDYANTGKFELTSFITIYILSIGLLFSLFLFVATITLIWERIKKGRK
jgi:hypothetical protein